MLEDLRPQTKQLPCKVRDILENLETSDQVLLAGYLQDWDTWSTNQLSKALSGKGLMVSPNTIMKHRTGLCSC
jgi:DNA-binding HxlR family transcriptional regulator